MTFTLFLLGALYVALVVALLASGVNGAMWRSSPAASPR